LQFIQWFNDVLGCLASIPFPLRVCVFRMYIDRRQDSLWDIRWSMGIRWIAEHIGQCSPSCGIWSSGGTAKSEGEAMRSAFSGDCVIPVALGYDGKAQIGPDL